MEEIFAVSSLGVAGVSILARRDIYCQRVVSEGCFMVRGGCVVV